MNTYTRRSFVHTSVSATVALTLAGRSLAATDRSAIYKQAEARHDESVQRLQAWIRQQSIAAENRGMDEGCEFTMQMLRDAGFQQVEKKPTDGQPGIFATARCRRQTHDRCVLHVRREAGESAEWSSPPWEARLVDMPNVGPACDGPRRRESEGTSVGVDRGVACNP